MKNTPPFLTGASLPNLLQLLRNNSVDKNFKSKLSSILFWPVVTLPLYLIERLAWSRTLSKINVLPPVFIIGHWRSGTTFLHYLLAQDKSFYAPTNFDVFAPSINIMGGALVKKIVAYQLPLKRPMDDVILHPDFPQEEEFALANLSSYSFYLGLVFPNNFKKWFRHFVLLKNVGKVARKKWSNTYHSFIQKLQHRAGSKTLLLKNPANTARIQRLIKLYPEAKFIYLYRQPTHVLQSTFRMMNCLLEINALQPFDAHDLQMNLAYMHKKMLRSYEKQRTLLSPKNLFEVSYEDMLNKPHDVVRKIYDQLDLPGFEKSEPDFERFIQSQKNYQPHVYHETATA